MSCAFYLFQLPKPWAKSFAIGQPIQLSELRGNARLRAQSLAFPNAYSCNGEGYFRLVTLPMGWGSATGVMQAVHRAILTRVPGKGQPLPTAAEIRKTGILPTGPDQIFQRGWQVYLDNFACLSVVHRERLERAQKEVDKWHAAAWAGWEHRHIPSQTTVCPICSLPQNSGARAWEREVLWLLPESGVSSGWRLCCIWSDAGARTDCGSPREPVAGTLYSSSGVLPRVYSRMYGTMSPCWQSNGDLKQLPVSVCRE